MCSTQRQIHQTYCVCVLITYTMTHIRTHQTIRMSFTKGVFCLRLLFRFRSAPERYGGNDNGMKEHSQTNRSLHDPINVIIVADHHHRFTESVPASSSVTCACNRTRHRLSTMAGGQRGPLRENDQTKTDLPTPCAIQHKYAKY